MKISDIAAYAKRGITPIYVEADGFAVVNQRCVKDGRINTGFIKYTSKGKKYPDEKKLRVGDILINSTGTGTLGRVAFVYDTSTISYADSHVTILRCKEYNSQFLYYWLRPLENYIESLGKGSTNQIELSDDAIFSIDIPEVGIDVQCRIADILSAYDNLIENNQKQIKLLKEAAQRLYKEWFVDLRFPGYEDAPIVDGVPEGWERLPVGELIEKIPRTTQIMASEYGKEGPIPIIDQSREFIAGYTDNHASLVNVGKPVIVFGDHTRILKYIQFPFAKGADGTQLIVSNTDRMPQSLFYCSLVGVDLSNYHYARHFKYLKAEELLVPTQVIAEAFDRFVSPMFSKIQRLRDINKAATNARDRLLPKLMSGEIEV